MSTVTRIIQFLTFGVWRCLSHHRPNSGPIALPVHEHSTSKYGDEINSEIEINLCHTRMCIMKIQNAVWQ